MKEKLKILNITLTIDPDDKDKRETVYIDCTNNVQFEIDKTKFDKEDKPWKMYVESNASEEEFENVNDIRDVIKIHQAWVDGLKNEDSFIKWLQDIGIVTEEDMEDNDWGMFTVPSENEGCGFWEYSFNDKQIEKLLSIKL